MTRFNERRFIYLALTRPKANLAMARRALVKIDEDYAAQVGSPIAAGAAGD